MSCDEQGNIMFASPLRVGAGMGATSDGALTFGIVTLDVASGVKGAWRCSFLADGRTACFRIELDEPFDRDDNAIPPLLFGEGRFFSEEDSDASTMLDALAKVLGASPLPEGSARTAALPFVYASFGDRLSPASGGGFQTKPVGGWTLAKLVLGENTEEDEGQVFLALCSSTGEGQFVIKDAEYGDIVLRHLATVL